MSSIPLTVYVGAVLALFLKTLTATLVQAHERLGHGTFAYPEDAAHWGGKRADDNERCHRAQRLLRNDSETQVWFLLLGGLYVSLGAWPAGAPWYFGAYVLSRWLHGLWLLHPKQPHRNRAFLAGLLLLLMIAGHVAYAALNR